MKNLRININEERDARRYIARAEHDFSSKLDSAIDGVFERGAAKIIALAGPTCSGKTTTANKLVERRLFLRPHRPQQRESRGAGL